jgi:hypothetical protein
MPASAQRTTIEPATARIGALMAELAPRDVRESRVRLRPIDTTHRDNPFLDGGWWPRTLNLSDEIPGLLRDVSRLGYETYRVSYRSSQWDTAPARMTVGGRTVKFGGYPSQGADTIALIDGSGRNRMVLLVIPPDTEQAVAERALDLAGTDGDQERAGEIVQRARAAG